MSEAQELKVGDKMRFSVELLEQLNQEGDRTQVVIVDKIENTSDGLKVVYLRVAR